MFTWLSNNLATIVICAILIVIVALIIGYLIRNRKKGRSSCGTGCAGCPMGGSCHQKK